MRARWSSFTTSRWSRHSDLTVRTNRSAKAFAFGVRNGVLRISVSSALNASSKLDTYFLSRSRTRNLVVMSASARSPVTFLAYWVTHDELG
jgi:hypothetical protein